MLWWEKTVEYNYVIKLSESGGLDFAAPLAGSVERLAGDGIFGKDYKMILVEFKKEKKELRTERDKFLPGKYLAAAKDLGGFSHHFIVYGELFAEQFELRACRYFVQESVAIADTARNGVDHVSFMDYIEKLKLYKKTDNRSSTGHPSMQELCSVIGVSKDNKVKVSTLDEYVFGPAYRKKPIGPIPQMEKGL